MINFETSDPTMSPTVLKWKIRMAMALDFRFPEKFAMDTDHPECPLCSGKMNFISEVDGREVPEGSAWWECPACHFMAVESEVIPFADIAYKQYEKFEARDMEFPLEPSFLEQEGLPPDLGDRIH